MMYFTDSEQLHDAVVAAGGLFETDMETLRTMHLAGRLGCHVRSDISSGLKSAKIHHWPAELPNDQRHQVLLYAVDTHAGRLMEIAGEVAKTQRSQNRAAA